MNIHEGEHKTENVKSTSIVLLPYQNYYYLPEQWEEEVLMKERTVYGEFDCMLVFNHS